MTMHIFQSSFLIHKCWSFLFFYQNYKKIWAIHCSRMFLLFLCARYFINENVDFNWETFSCMAWLKLFPSFFFFNNNLFSYFFYASYKYFCKSLIYKHCYYNYYYQHCFAEAMKFSGEEIFHSDEETCKCKKKRSKSYNFW